MYYYFLGLALLLVRIILSIIFFTSVRNKVQNIKKFARNNSLPAPLAYLLVVVEAFTVISLLPGVLPRLGGLAVMAVMSGSMYFHIHKWKSPYWAAKGGWEYDLMIFAMALVVVVLGGGIFSLWPEPSSWLLFVGF